MVWIVLKVQINLALVFIKNEDNLKIKRQIGNFDRDFNNQLDDILQIGWIKPSSLANKKDVINKAISRELKRLFLTFSIMLFKLSKTYKDIKLEYYPKSYLN